MYQLSFDWICLNVGNINLLVPLITSEEQLTVVLWQVLWILITNGKILGRVLTSYIWAKWRHPPSWEWTWMISLQLWFWVISGISFLVVHLKVRFVISYSIKCNSWTLTCSLRLYLHLNDREDSTSKVITIFLLGAAPCPCLDTKSFPVI